MHCTGRQFANGRWVVVKTHYWSDDWDPKQADHVFLTHRELSEVVASYKRVGWAFNIPDSYVREHEHWQVQPLSLATDNTSKPWLLYASNV